MTGNLSASSIFGGISGAYENRDKQGVTYAVVGQSKPGYGKVVIGGIPVDAGNGTTSGVANPVVLGEVKRDTLFLRMI